MPASLVKVLNLTGIVMAIAASVILPRYGITGKKDDFLEANDRG